MRVGDDILKEAEVVVQPKQMGLQGVEAVPAGQGLRHRRGMPEGPNETGVELLPRQQHPAPKRPQAGCSGILERPDRMLGGLRPQQGLGLFDQGLQAGRFHKRLVVGADQIPLQRQGRQHLLVQFDEVSVLPMALGVVRRRFDSEIVA